MVPLLLVYSYKARTARIRTFTRERVSHQSKLIMGGGIAVEEKIDAADSTVICRTYRVAQNLAAPLPGKMDEGPSKYISDKEGLPNIKISMLFEEILCNFLHIKYLFVETSQFCHFYTLLFTFSPLQ